jgi:hypothetical protein
VVGNQSPVLSIVIDVGLIYIRGFMLIGEIVQRKEYLKLKIKETEKKLSDLTYEDIEPQKKGALYSTLLDTLFTLLSKLQSHRALLDKENASTEVLVGEATLSVLDAVHIRNTIERKIDTLTEIIENMDKQLGQTDLLNKRDLLMEDYISISNSIEKNDWAKDVE